MTILQAWRIMRIFAWSSQMERLIDLATRPLCIILASAGLQANGSPICSARCAFAVTPLLLVGLTFIFVPKFYYRNDSL